MRGLLFHVMEVLPLDRILDGGFVRVGPYVLSGKTLEGGPVEIPEWTSWTPKVAKAGKATDA